MKKSGKDRGGQKNKGFGQPLATPTKDATEFVRRLGQAIQKSKGDQKKITQFLQKNVEELDEHLLNALPFVFQKMTANKHQGERERIAGIYGISGSLLIGVPFGKRQLNLELAIVALQLATKVFTRKESPRQWAAIQNDLGAAYRNRIRGERAENLEKAIATNELALQIRTKEAFPEAWATTQINLGVAYNDRIRGERAENLEKAIAAYELALQILTKEAFPEDWATTQNNLGTAYGDRIRGERADNLEKAIAAYELALQIHTREAFPEAWAKTQNNLGTAYGDRIRGERAENLEKAIAAYELALQIQTREAFPEDWAKTQNNLGTAYVDRIKGERAENLEKAIATFELALQISTEEADPDTWASIQNNLGYVFNHRIKGNRAENIEKAIAAYMLALRIRTKNAFPEDWADLQRNLANAYRNRVNGDPADNLERSISLHRQASEVFTRESFPDKWAENQSKLAESFIKRSSLMDCPEDLETAIALLQAALEVAAPGSPHFIDAQYQLGNALSRRYESSQDAQDLEAALRAYSIAFEAISLEHYDRSKIWQALPETQSILGSRMVRDGQWREGLQLLLNSVSQLSTGGDHAAHANALFETARAHEALTDWNNARLYYRDALRWYTHINHLPGIAKSQEGLGGVLVSQGYLKKGLAELAKARDGYRQLQKADKAAVVDNFYQSVQRALAKQQPKVTA